mgnify:CR=1 FL=1
MPGAKKLLTEEARAAEGVVRVLEEAGIDMVTVATPSVIAVHKDTPDDIVATLENAIREAVSRPRYQEKLIGMGIQPVFADAGQIYSYLDASMGPWKELVDRAKAAAS